LISGLEEDFMDLKAAAYGTPCLTALSLCLAGGCGSNTPTPGAPRRSPGYFGTGQGVYKDNDAILKEYYAKNKGKARTKPQAK
jgi:hypothetical protein